MANYYYSGQGSLYVAERDEVTGKATGFVAVGNVPALTINIETTKLEHKESETGGRLTDLTIVREKKGTFEFTLENLDLEMLAMSVWGESAVVAAGNAVDEVLTIYKANPISRYPVSKPKISTVVVKSDDGLTTYVANTDYTVDATNGVILPVDGGAIDTAVAALGVGVNSLNLKVSYAYAANVKMDAFTQSNAPTRWLRFEGINTVDDSRVIVDIFKAQFDPMTGYGLINEELGSVAMKGSILADLTRVSGSKFFSQVNA